MQLTPELLARTFHESYERLAVEHGYETRDDSRQPWEQVPEQNRKLMMATAEAVIAQLGLASRSDGDVPAETARPLRRRTPRGSDTGRPPLKPES